MKKILFIHHAKGWGGAPINMINIINSLDRSKYEPFVLLIKDSIVSKKLEENGIQYKVAKSKFYKKYYLYFSHTVPGYTKWYQFYHLFRMITSWIMSRYYYASKELNNIEFDLVQLNSSVLTDWLAPCKNKGKVIINIQEPVSKGYLGIRHSFFKRQENKYADKIIAISKDNANRVGIQEKTEIIYNYADVPNNEPTIESYSSKKFLYLGGSAQIKGFFTMVKALDYFDDDIKVYFGGSYPDTNKKRSAIKIIIKWVLRYGVKQQKAIEKLKNHPRAEIIGQTNDVNRYLDEVCCLISPFTVSHFSRPVIEAHLHKKPAIGSSVKGMDEIIKHKKNGLIFPTDNAKELTKAINYLANHPEETKKMGEEGYNIAKIKFTPENIKQFEKLYDSL